VNCDLLIVGLDNPQSSDPRYALFPHPSGCAGHRLMNMMMEVSDSLTRRMYIAVPKSNLFPCGRIPTKGRKGHMTVAAAVLVASLSGTDKKVVLLGNEVRNAVLGESFGKKWPPAKFAVMHGGNYAWIPHPSGRNPYYNNERKRKKIGRFLCKMVGA